MRKSRNSPVPVQPFLVVPVKEVWLIPHGSHVGVHPESLQEGPGPPFLHPDDDGLREFLLSVIRSAVDAEVAVRGAELLVLPLQHGGVERRLGGGRRGPNPLHGPLLGLGMLPDAGQRAPVSLGETLGSGVKFPPQCGKSCLLCHQAALKHVVLLQGELQRVVAAHQAVKQVCDREGKGEHE